MERGERAEQNRPDPTRPDRPAMEVTGTGALLLLLLLLLLVLLLLQVLSGTRTPGHGHLPPGPAPLPLLGNLLQLRPGALYSGLLRVRVWEEKRERNGKRFQG